MSAEGYEDHPGIDYGLGTTNIDRSTGIRFGVISLNSLGDWVWDKFLENADYGEPTCPQCNGDVVEYYEETHGEYEEYTDGVCCELACESCKHILDTEQCLPEEPIGMTIDTEEYKASIDSDHDVMLFKSPYFTYAQFCSPCVPGAGHLEHPCWTGTKTYCFDKSWFQGGVVPYPVFNVKTGIVVE